MSLGCPRQSHFSEGGGFSGDIFQHSLSAERDTVDASVLPENPALELVLTVGVRVKFLPALEEGHFMAVFNRQDAQQPLCALRNGHHRAVPTPKPILPLVDAEANLVVKEFGPDRLHRVVDCVHHQGSLGVTWEAVQVAVPGQRSPEVLVLAIRGLPMPPCLQDVGPADFCDLVRCRIDFENSVG